MNNMDRVLESLKMLGIAHRVDSNCVTVSMSMGDIYIYSDGRVTHDRGMKATVDKIKAQYAEQTVRSWAKKKGFMTSQKKHPETKEEMLVVVTGY
jgi:hypothetical protein